MNITEDYVSFETAKLLKEKGFKGQGDYFYEKNKIVNFINYWYRITPKQRYEAIEAPTLQIVMKWLREVHNIFICIIPSEVGAGVMDYTYVLYKINAKNFYFEDLCIQGRAENINEISYEKTVETAIKYCLENLI